MRLFIRFNYHFFRIIWHFHAVFLSLFTLIVGIAVIISHIEKLPFGEDACRAVIGCFSRTHRHHFYRDDGCRGNTCSW